MRLDRLKWVLLSAVLATAGCAARPVAEQSVAARFEALKASPPQLSAFLRAMPKGGDLHNHMSGAIYAESFIAWAIEDGLCLKVATQTITPPPCDAANGLPPVKDAVAKSDAYNALIDAFSVRNYAIRPVSGHDQFFATFDRYDAADSGRKGDMLAEVRSRAGSQNILYLELMDSSGMGPAAQLGRKVGWDDDFGRMYERLIAAGLPGVAADAGADFARMEARSREIMACAGATPDPGCAVDARFIAQVIRVFPKEQVFAEIALGFLLASQDQSVVGLNLVAPEDDRVSLGDYSLHMHMIAALHERFPDVRVTLHAGELTLGLVPPKDLRFHIAQAVRVAGASRIGHGVDIMDEDAPETLLAEMARKQVMVEINLTSNDVILGVAGDAHPFETYRAFGVPLALSTDDEGVSRIDLTHEYGRAVLTYDLSYADVKQLSRNSLTYAFVKGASLWSDPRHARRIEACRADRPGTSPPSAACTAFLGGSEKARLQWALETAFERFEAAQASPPLRPVSLPRLSKAPA